jgi:hypothetical protein
MMLAGTDLQVLVAKKPSIFASRPTRSPRWCKLKRAEPGLGKNEVSAVDPSQHQRLKLFEAADRKKPVASEHQLTLHRKRGELVRVRQWLEDLDCAQACSPP